MEAWYALYTKPNSEALVARTLTARGFAPFFPMLPARPGQRIQPLFPTYLFLRCDMEQVGLATLQWVPGLRCILNIAGRPAVVPDRAIALIEDELARIEAQGGLPAHPFKVGDEVVIDEGPLAGLRGVFQGPVGPAERVRILIRFLGQANRAEVPVKSLRRAGEAGGQAPRRRGTRGGGRHIHYDPAGSPGGEHD